MPMFLSLFSCWLLLSGSGSQAPPIAFLDVPVITENSVGKARIGMPLPKLKEAYKGCTFSPEYLSKYGFDEYSNKPNATVVSRGGQKLFVFWMNPQTQKITGLIVLNPSYQTAQGMHTGSTSRQLKAVFPAMRAVPNMLMQDIEMAFLGEVDKPGIEYTFFKQEHIGKFVVADEPVKMIATNARISWIQIFPNP